MTTSIINCAIADDEPLPVELLKDYIAKTPGLHLTAAVRNPLHLLEVVDQQPVQLVFLDIQMPELTGFQVMKLLQNKCQIIITTAYPEYALDGYEHDVVDYLLKPFGFDRFLMAINKCKKRLLIPAEEPKAEPTHFFVKSGQRLTKIFHNEVVYLEAMRDYVGIHLGKEKVLTLQSLTSFELQLPERFVRIHRSYIVNADKVVYREGNIISIGTALLPVGEKYQERIAKMFQ